MPLSIISKLARGGRRQTRLVLRKYLYARCKNCRKAFIANYE
ncbi:MAG: hypothetical protein ACK53Y_05110 [bacterium]